MPIRVLAAAVAGVLLSLAFEPVALPVLAPLAVAGFVLTTRGLGPGRAVVPAVVFGVTFYYTHIYWMTAVGIDAWIALSTLEASFYAVLGPVVAVLGRRRAWPLWSALAWTAMEAIRSVWPFSGMPWGRLAFATVDTPWAEVLPWLGATGVSFLMALLGSAIAWLVVARGRERMLAGGVVVGLVLGSLLPTQVPYPVQQDGEVTVAAVQGNVPGNGDDILADYRQVTANHVDATVALAADVAAGREPRPDLVLWPENSTAVDPFHDAETNAGIRTAVAAIGVPVLVGAIVDAGPRHVLNQGIVWDPATGPGDRYTKWHPVPYGEFIPFRSVFEGTFGRLALIPRDMLPGHRTTPLRIDGALLADAICFDIAYDDGIRAQLRNGGQLLVVQTSNATFIHTHQIEQQFAISRLRAIESGRYLVVAATNGISGIVAPDGTVLERADKRTQRVLVAPVGLSSTITPAIWLGPWPGRLAIALTAVGLLLTLARRRSGAGTAASVPYRRGRRPGAADGPTEEPAPAGVVAEN